MQEILRHSFLWQDTTYFITVDRNGIGTAIPLNLHDVEFPAFEIGPDMQPMGPQLHWHYILSELISCIHLPPALNSQLWELHALRERNHDTHCPRTHKIILRAQERTQSAVGTYINEWIQQGVLMEIN